MSKSLNHHLWFWKKRTTESAPNDIRTTAMTHLNSHVLELKTKHTHRKRSTKNMHQPNSVRLKSWICTTRPKTIPKLGKIKQETHIKCIVIAVLCFLLLLLIRVFWRLHFVAKWSSFLNLSEKKGQLNALIYSVLPSYQRDKKGAWKINTENKTIRSNLKLKS